MTDQECKVIEDVFWLMFFVGSSEMRQNWYGDLLKEERAYIHEYAARTGGHLSKWLDAMSVPHAILRPADVA